MKLSMKKLDFEDKYQVYGRIVGIKSLLEVTAAKVRVTAAKQNLEDHDLGASRLELLASIQPLGLLRTLLDQNLASIDDIEAR
ncbi:hypothetical protein Tco_1548827 [Tanacetum coccineum]